jgi:NTE family protein
MNARQSQGSSTRETLPAKAPKIGLALGGGGARGLAHIAMLEAFDELSIRPSVIAGTSIGAVYGAAYASGISGRDLREHTRFILSQRLGLIRDLFVSTTQPFQRLASLFGARSAILNPAAVLDVILPKEVKNDFADCEIPLKIVASDFYDQEPKIFSDGLLRPAIAASMALPVIFQPVVVDGRALIDGGLTNPLPFDLLMPEADVVVAIDVSGAPVPDPRRATPTAFEALFASAFLFERTIVKEKLKAARPDILISAGTSRFQVLDFLKCDEILAAAEPAKERLKQQLTRVLSVETLPVLDVVDPTTVADGAQAVPSKRPKQGLLARARRRRKED